MHYKILGVWGLWYLMPLSTIFQLYHDGKNKKKKKILI